MSSPVPGGLKRVDERSQDGHVPGRDERVPAARDELLEREIELRREMEAVAAARRALPPGGLVPEDYVFQGAAADGTTTDIRMSELFAPGRNSLVIYNFMFPARGQRRSSRPAHR